MALQKYTNIKGYQVFLERTPSKPLNSDKTILLSARIKCALEDGHYVWFTFVEGDEIPSLSFNEQKKELIVYRAASTYAYYLDLLRNEKPVGIWFYDANKVVQLATGSEPIGEGPGESV